MYEIYWETHLKDAAEKSGEVSGICPFHDDTEPSFCGNVKTGKAFCHGCGWKGNAITFAKELDIPLNTVPGYDSSYYKKDIPAEPGSNGKKIVETYGYTDETGKLLFESLRYDPKNFLQRQPDGNGGYIWNLNGVTRVPYHLPDIIQSQKVIICEGEKDCNILKDAGFCATTNAGGAGKWLPEYNPHFKDKDVIILPDNDDPGHKHAQQVKKILNQSRGH